MDEIPTLVLREARVGALRPPGGPQRDHKSGAGPTTPGSTYVYCEQHLQQPFVVLQYTIYREFPYSCLYLDVDVDVVDVRML